MMAAGRVRGADIVARTLARAGTRTVFALSGNHVMSVFDAAIDPGLDLLHVRHEAAAVHMADAWGRLHREPGVALVTGGQGHTNAIAAAYPALAAESPMLLLSGHAPTRELGRGAFQELAQATMAAPVTKASHTAAATASLGHDLARAWRTAVSGRMGPVHLSLPSDLLEASVDDHPGLYPQAEMLAARASPLAASACATIRDALATARRPLLLAGPACAGLAERERLEALGARWSLPCCAMQSPRGVNDPALGAFAEVLAQADLIVLLGKALDFTLKFGEQPAIGASCRFLAIDPDPQRLRALADGLQGRLLGAWTADVAPALSALIAAAGGPPVADGQRAPDAPGDAGWYDAAVAAFAWRPPAWQGHAQAGQRGDSVGKGDAPLHPVRVISALDRWLSGQPRALLVSDGGEIGQWCQAVSGHRDRLINGVAGSIGPSIPFALAAAVARPGARIAAVLGDGTFGFHMAEFDTAVRRGLPIVAIVGNDARWNAEYQIQMRDYGAGRARGCELLPTRYDRVVEALGGHGEFVTRDDALEPALARAFASGRPACVNVLTQGLPAPVLRRSAPA
jgi:acetolactate synthase-1/2/3 large subunit